MASKQLLTRFNKGTFMSTPIISVVLPVFNAQEFISTAIESILKQTFTNFELNILDDGSTDGTLKIINYFAKKDQRVNVFSRPNKGLVTTLNELIELSNGIFIARMDADDISLPTRLEKQYLAYKNAHNPLLIGCWVDVFGNKNERWHYRRTDAESRTFSLFGRCCLLHPTFFAKKILFEKYKYRKKYTHLEDLDLLHRVMLSEQGSIFSVPEVLYKYRTHSQSICANQFIKQQALRKKLIGSLLYKLGCELNESELLVYFCFLMDKKAHNVEALKQTLIKIQIKTQEFVPDNVYEFEYRWLKYCSRHDFKYKPLHKNTANTVCFL